MALLFLFFSCWDPWSWPSDFWALSLLSERDSWSTAQPCQRAGIQQRGDPFPILSERDSWSTARPCQRAGIQQRGDPSHFSQRETAGAPPNRAREQEYNREMTLFPILLVRDSWSTAQPYQRAGIQQRGDPFHFSQRETARAPPPPPSLPEFRNTQR
jgi:hypothetical protein